MDLRDELILSVAYVLAKQMPHRQRQTRPQREAEVQAVAEMVVKHLESSLWTFGKKPPGRSHSWPPPGWDVD